MSTAIGNFTAQLHDNLEAVEDSPKATLHERAKSLDREVSLCAEAHRCPIVLMFKYKTSEVSNGF